MVVINQLETEEKIKWNREMKVRGKIKKRFLDGRNISDSGPTPIIHFPSSFVMSMMEYCTNIYELSPEISRLYRSYP
jgi:hypothetical protein